MAIVRRLALIGALSAAALAGGVTQSASALPPVKHVFIVMLENENAAETFGPNSKAPFLARELPAIGGYVQNYFATGHLSLDNYISMVSGQGPNPITQADCQI